MSGKYRPVSTAEKRAMLEAAGEEWPIGGDGLPKVWSSNSRDRYGGSWMTRSRHREHCRNARLKVKEKASRDPVFAEMLKKRSRALTLSQAERDRKRRSAGRKHLIGQPPMSLKECGQATQDLYDRDPEAWARNKRALREAGLKRTRTRLEGEVSNG